MPQQNTTNAFWNNDFLKSMSGFSSFPMDTKSVVDSARKNTQAMNDAMKLCGENSQAFMKRCTEIMSQLVEDQSALAKEIMSEGSPEQKIAKQAEMMRKNYERSVTNLRELSDMLNKSNTEASDLINKRVTASFSEIKSMLENATSSQNKKSA